VFVLGPIRQDGSGVSYRAWSPGENGPVTLWIDGRRVEDDPIRAERLARQAIALERVRHPNLAEVVRFDEFGGRLAVVERNAGRGVVDPDPEGGSLPGPSEVRRAVATGLQAARGLAALHQAGLIHGDLKVEALARGDDGRVILTGLGRAAPPVEEAEPSEPIALPDPSAAREDLRALGRVLFELVTGTAVGVSEALGDRPTPKSINPRVPAALSDLIERLMRPDDPGDDLTITEVVAELERLVGAPKPGEFLPRAELVEAYRAIASDYAEAPTARLKRTVLLSSYGGTAALAGLSWLIGLRSLAIGLAFLMVMTAGCSFVVGGVRRGGPVFDRVRRFLLGGRARDLATVLAAVVLAVFGLKAAGLLGLVVVLALVGAIFAGLQEAFIDRMIEEERREPLDRAEALLRDLRAHGLAEEGVRAFAVDHGGEHWGPIVLALFGFDGYRAGLSRRTVPIEERLARVELSRRVIAGIDTRLKARRDERDRVVLTALEERRLKAAGVFELTARRRSWRIAPAVLSRLRAFEAGEPMPEGNLAAAIAGAIRQPEHVLIESEAESTFDRFRRRALDLFDAITGPRMRLLAGLALLVGFLAWAHQNRLIQGEDLQGLVEQARTIDDLDDLDELAGTLNSQRQRLQDQAEGAEPLRVEAGGISGPLGEVFRGPGAGLAALILLVSSAFPNRWVALGSIAAAGFVLLTVDLGG
jgi:hypothetical protein